MASSQYQENQSCLNQMYYDSHKSVIERVCMALGKLDRSTEMTTLILGEKIKIKFKKDPNKPKKAKSGFLFFCDIHRPKMIADEKKKNNKIVIGNIAKELGKKWGKLTDKEKVKFKLMNDKDKVRYTQEMEVYNNNIFNVV